MDFIFLIGPPGSGKTVCGQALSSALGCAFYDTDKLIEADQKCTIANLFERHGEAYFRQLESNLLESLPVRHALDEKVVFATGGGLPVYNDNLRRLEQLGKVVALSATLPVLIERVKTNTDRPLLAAAVKEEADDQLRKRLSELIATRSPVYDRAGYKIDTSGLKPDEVAKEIIRMIYGN